MTHVMSKKVTIDWVEYEVFTEKGNTGKFEG